MRERAAAVVRVPVLMLHEAARSYPEFVRWRDRAKLVMQQLGRCLACGLPDALLAAGYVTGLWGRPSRWDPGGRRLRSLV